MIAPRVLKADRGDAGRRLDLVLTRHLTDLRAATRTRVQSWIADGRVTVNGVAVRRAAARTAFGDEVAVALPAEAGAASARPMSAQPAGSGTPDLHILHEDDHLMLLAKPVGLVVHPGYKHAEGTLMNALLWHARGWPAGQRPSIVGRLDKLTSGVVLVAKSAPIHAALQRAADTEKDYLAVVYGRVPARGRIAVRLGRSVTDRRRVVPAAATGAASLTLFERLGRVAAPRAGLALLRCRLVTGRMHQIRVHLAARGWPLVGDPVYGEPRWSRMADASLAAAVRAFDRQALHAWRVAFTHPASGERLAVEAPLPDDLDRLLAATGLRTCLTRVTHVTDRFRGL